MKAAQQLCVNLVAVGANQNSWFTWIKPIMIIIEFPCERMSTRTCPAYMEQAEPDLTSPRVYQSPGRAGAHLSGLNQLFWGYLILCESVFWPVFHGCRSAKSIRTSSNLAQSSFHANCTRRICLCWNQTFVFGFLVRRRWNPGSYFNRRTTSVIWWRLGQTHHKLAQFVGHRRTLNLLFCLSQIDDWLTAYGHFKFWCGVVLQN